jgi:alanyl-tRNA synthetase
MDAIADGASKRLDASEEIRRAYRVIADHARSAVFILGDEKGVSPGNVGQGYVLRRLIRRMVRYAHAIGMKEGFLKPLAEVVADSYRHVYPELAERRETIIGELVAEESKFEKTLDRGTAELDKVIEAMARHGQTVLPGRVAFRLYDTCGFPLEFTEEICRERGLSVDREGFEKAFAKHRDVSRQGAEQIFKGGLADNSEATTCLHTATHLLHKSLQMVLGEHVKQKGSNITPERLRFDFSHPEKMTPEQIKQVEDLVNGAIQRGLDITMSVMTIDEAREEKAMALFAGKYGEQVKVYRIGDFSTEVCGGPHVRNTGELGRFRIVKEESSSAGVRRIRAVLE